MSLVNLLLIGGGKMGGALLQRVAAEAQSCVVDPALPPEHLKSLPGVTWLPAPDKIDAQFKPDIVIIAIKPQHVAEVLPSYSRFRDSVFLSIAAGQTLNRVEMALGSSNYAVARAMPNLPASIGQGAAVAVANKNVNPAQRALCDKILKAVGTVEWVQDEDLLDAVTALSGSGPAYVFALTEALAKGGEALGLPQALAAKLARQTVIGSGGLLAETNTSATDLRVAVTSPAGTTEAALKILLAPGSLPELMLKAMQAAAKRAKELS
jgi:pyrroline-5-carboxylate reductase